MSRGGKRTGAGRRSGSKGRITVELKATLTETAKAYTVQALQALADVLVNPKAPAAAIVSAANSMLDRGWGKPPQQLEHTGAQGGPIQVSDARERLEHIIDRTAAEGAKANGVGRPH